MVRRFTVETVCFEILLASVFAGFAVWIWGMLRKSFGAIPAALWIVFTCISLVCVAIIGVIEFIH